MSIDAELLRRAKHGPTEVLPSEVLGNTADWVFATLSNTAPDWLHAELACEGLRLYLDKSNAWILAPLDE